MLAQKIAFLFLGYPGIGVVYIDNNTSMVYYGYTIMEAFLYEFFILYYPFQLAHSITCYIVFLLV